MAFGVSEGRRRRRAGASAPSVSPGALSPSLQLTARHLSCVMGKQRGAPAGEGCWIPAGAKAASGRDGERAVACARHGGRDAPLGLRAALLMESRARAAPVAERSRADGIRGVPCRCPAATTKNQSPPPHPARWWLMGTLSSPLPTPVPPLRAFSLSGVDRCRAGRTGSPGPPSTWLGEGVASAFWHPLPHERAPLTALSSLQTSQFHCS